MSGDLWDCVYRLGLSCTPLKIRSARAAPVKRVVNKIVILFGLKAGAQCHECRCCSVFMLCPYYSAHTLRPINDFGLDSIACGVVLTSNW